MKIKYLILLAIIIVLPMSSCIQIRMTSLKGDGNVVTKQIDITEFDKIELEGGVMVNYTQVEGVSALRVQVDRNIYDAYSFTVQNRTLRISTKSDFVNIKPTCFNVTANSDRLRDVDIQGGGIVNLFGRIESSELEFHISGSGRIDVKDALYVDELDVDISGSGNFYVNTLRASDLDVSVSGSGSVLLGGDANNAYYRVSGSGKIDAGGLQALKCDVGISGSGRAFVFATDKLDASVSGSGRVRYKGLTNVTKHISGSGSIQQVSE